MSKIKNRREKILENPFSRVCVVRTQESEMLYSLINGCDNIFKRIKNRVGVDLDFEIYNEFCAEWAKEMVKLSDILAIVAEKNNIQYGEPFLIKNFKIKQKEKENKETQNEDEIF